MTGPGPRLIAGDGAATAPAGTVRIAAEDPAVALAELAWAIERGAEAVIVPDLDAARDFLIVHAALHGWVELDPELALDPELRREPVG